MDTTEVLVCNVEFITFVSQSVDLDVKMISSPCHIFNSITKIWDLWDLGVVRLYLVDRWPKTACPWTRVWIVECTDFLRSQPAAQCCCSAQLNYRQQSCSLEQINFGSELQN